MVKSLLFKNEEFLSDVEKLAKDLSKIINKTYVWNQVKNNETFTKSLELSGVTDIALPDKVITLIHNFKQKYDGMITVDCSYGITHHKDTLWDMKGYTIITPILKNQKYYFKYIGIDKIEREHEINYMEPVIFNSKKLHSLAPVGIPSKYPFTFLGVWI
jgi:hypothetical protein